MTQLQRLVIAASQLLAGQIALTDQQHHYLCRVLRLRPGDQFIAVTEQGWQVATLQPHQTAELALPPTPTDLQDEQSQPEQPQAQQPQTELPLALILLIALPKTGMDEVVRQATEIGVTTIQPILSQRTLLKPSDQKLERWQRIAQEASEQSERQKVPEILPPLLWQLALQQWNAPPVQGFICEPRGTHPHLLDCLTRSPGVLSYPALSIAVGTEGGWTATELEQALQAGYQPVSLGTRILRAVTAPLVALSLVAAAIEARTMLSESTHSRIQTG